MKRLLVISLKFGCFLLYVTAGTANKLPKQVVSNPVVFDAVLREDAAELRKALEAGANPNEKAFWGWAPLHQAMFSRVELTQILLDYKSDVDIRVADYGPIHSNGWSPLFYAVNVGRGDLVAELTTHGAQVNLEDAANHTPLFYALRDGRDDIANMLMRAGARPLDKVPRASPKKDPAYYPHGAAGIAVSLPPLFTAVMLHDVDRVAALLREGADPNEKSPFGWAALHKAMKSDLVVCRLLIEYGADVNLRVTERKHSNDWTALFFAAYYGRDDLVIELLRHGANPELTDSLGRLPAWYATDQRHNTTVELLRSAVARKQRGEPMLDANKRQIPILKRVEK